MQFCIQFAFSLEFDGPIVLYTRMSCIFLFKYLLADIDFCANLINILQA